MNGYDEWLECVKRAQQRMLEGAGGGIKVEETVEGLVECIQCAELTVDTSWFSVQDILFFHGQSLLPLGNASSFLPDMCSK